MEPKDQVASVEPAKRLEELGVKQESLWYWANVKTLEVPYRNLDRPAMWIWQSMPPFINSYKINPNTLRGYGDPKYPDDGYCISAFTVAEALDNLPYQIPNIGELQIYHDENGWLIGYDPDCFKVAASARKLSDAACKLKIHLIEKGIIKL